MSSLDDSLRAFRARGWLISLWRRVAAFSARLVPSPNLVRGAAWGLIVATLLALTILGLDLMSGLGPAADVAIAWIVGGLAFLLAIGITHFVLAVARRLPATATAVGLLSLVALINFFALPMPVAWPLGLAAWLAAAALGAAVYGLVRGDRRTRIWVTGIAAILLIGLGIGWLAWPGPDANSRAREDDVRRVPPLPLANPAAPGPWAVESLAYGSGTDRRRIEYGAAVDLPSQVVDGSAFVRFEGIGGRHRRWYWGFDETALPLNGRVWLPVGDGPFPLVLVVHGNHDMADFSDAGYGYLGEHLASHGLIVVSVDENFLNGNFAGAPERENDARGWLLLKHLEQWRQWNERPDHPLAGKADLEQVALVGHSRGGEAASIAAAFNRLPAYPDDATVGFAFGFGVRGVVAVAPSDQQYRPVDRALPLENINYLVIQGSHDADVNEYIGYRQYQRVSLTEPRFFKAGLYIHQANHGQFNTDWGRSDFGLPRNLLLNTAPLMPGAAQRRVALVAITAFLQATLLGEPGYQAFFQDHRAGLDWLPDTLYVSQYQDGTFRAVTDYEEDIDVASTTIAGGTIRASGFDDWREVDVKFRQNVSQDNQAVWLAWEEPGATYALSLPSDAVAAWQLNGHETLSFNLANGSQETDAPLDLSVELVDRDGRASSLALGETWTVLPPLATRFTKWFLWEERFNSPTDRISQTYRLSLVQFAERNPDLDLDALATIRFVFDRTPAGDVYLDEIGFAR